MTAERFDPEHAHDGDDSAWRAVHRSRYLFAARHIGLGRVLDLSCGTGHGLVDLASPGRFVTGMDLSLDTLRRIRSASPESSLAAGDGTQLPFATNSIDAVVSLETIEHIPDRPAFVREISRILKPSGRLVLSTPNALVSPHVDGKPRNPFHLFEYKPDELVAEIGAHFVIDHLLGQAVNRRFRVSPFQDEYLPYAETGLVPKAEVTLWRVFNRLPAKVGSRLSGLVWDRPLLPSENDFDFSADLVQSASVTVVVATNRKGS